MNLHATSIQGLYVAEAIAARDRRGQFSRLYCERELERATSGRRIVQINFSQTSARGAIRGMHFQYQPQAETKMVRCLRGAVFDVAVDLRAGSPTFLKWYAEELRPENGRMMIIPEGFAHGFQTLEPESELLYLHTAFYTPELEAGVRYNDPALAIRWPLPLSEISERDIGHPPIGVEFKGVRA